MNALILKIKSIARQIGLLPLIERMVPRGPYEAEFGKALLAEVRPGDVVWDVGAKRRLLHQAVHRVDGTDGEGSGI